MGTNYPDLFAALAAPFADGEVKQRSQAGRTFKYITARTAMNRLDSVLGPENWWDEYVPLENSVICKLTVCLPDGTVVTKADAGGHAGMQDQGDDDKSGFSDAFKRAAAKFGVARYLYRDGVPAFVRERQPDTESPPARAPEPRRPSPAPAPSGGPRDNVNVPRTGKSLFAWVLDLQNRHEGLKLLDHLNRWRDEFGHPFRMTDWPPHVVAKGYEEGVRYLKSVEARHADDTAA